MIHGAWKSVTIVALVTSLALVGCSKKTEDTTSSEPAPAPTAEAPAPSAPAPGVNMQDGQWEITMKVDMPGMPAEAMKPHTVTTCLTKENYVPKTDQNQSDCKIESQKIDGNTVSWAVACKESTGKGSITYAGDSMEGTMESTMKIEGQEMTTKIAMSGKRVGSCPGK